MKNLLRDSLHTGLLFILFIGYFSFHGITPHFILSNEKMKTEGMLNFGPDPSKKNIITVLL